MKQKITLAIITVLFFSTNLKAQDNIITKRVESSVSKKSKVEQNNDSIFKAHLVNDEFQVWIDLDLYHNNILVPRQEIFGEVPGYFGAVRDTRKWIISDATIKGKKAILTIINDYGSEDLTASFVNETDSTIVLKQLEGSAIKIARNSKWQKLPKQMTFVRKK